MLRSLILCGMVLGVSSAGLLAENKESKTKEVKVRDLKLSVPESWKSETPKSRMRLGQFKIPAVKGDKEDGELLIFSFPGGGGDKTANIKRWIGQFDAEGRKSKTVKGVSEQGEYLIVNISGTYQKSVGPPFLKQTKTVKNARMLGVILNIKDKGVYYLKFAGPDKTVQENLKALKKSYGADEKTEKEVEIK
jgi:hypothetical protein